MFALSSAKRHKLGIFAAWPTHASSCFLESKPTKYEHALHACVLQVLHPLLTCANPKCSCIARRPRHPISSFSCWSHVQVEPKLDGQILPKVNTYIIEGLAGGPYTQIENTLSVRPFWPLNLCLHKYMYAKYLKKP